jgi:hypothetical protein
VAIGEHRHAGVASAHARQACYNSAHSFTP